MQKERKNSKQQRKKDDDVSIEFEFHLNLSWLKKAFPVWDLFNDNQR